jgi:hypothetical protein
MWHILDGNVHVEYFRHRCLKFVGMARTVYVNSVYTVFLAGKSPNIRSYTMHIQFWPTLYIRYFGREVT